MAVTLRALGLFLITFVGGCITPGPWVSLSLRSLPPQSTWLQVTLQPVGKPDIIVRQRLNRPASAQPLEVEIPRDWPDRQLTLDIMALDQSRCEVGQGHTVIDIPATARLPEPARKRRRRWRRGSATRAWRPIAMALSLTAFPTRCPVSIVATGDVPLEVTAGGPPVQCPHHAPCQLAFAPGTAVRMRAGIDPDVTFWSGACQSRGASCDFVVNGPAEVTVSFARPVCRRGFCWYNPERSPHFSDDTED